MTILEEIVAERDKMIARAHRGTARDDGYTHERWIHSLQGLFHDSYEPRHMWIKVAAVALRAVEAIDRRAT